MLDALLTSTAAAETITMSGTVTIILSSLALGLFISLIYRFTERERGASASFAVTLIMLPSIIAMIILLVGNNAARALSLAGAFSIIRFRSAPGDPKDIGYIFFTHGVGATFRATCSVSRRSMLLCWPTPLASLTCCTSAFFAPWTSTFLTVSTGKKKSTAHTATTASTATNAHRRRACLLRRRRSRACAPALRGRRRSRVVLSSDMTPTPPALPGRSAGSHQRAW